MRIFLLLMLLIPISACVPQSKNPLTGFDRDAMDTSVFGTWFWKDERHSGYLHIGQEKESGLLVLMMVKLDSSGKIDVTQLQGHTSLLGELRYLNLKLVAPIDGISGYIFLKYVIEDEGLGLVFMDPSIIKKAIEDKELDGRVELEDRTSSVHLTETSNKLQQFVVEHDQELFSEMNYLSRLVLPQGN